MKKYHEILGQDVRFTLINANNTIPYYFDDENCRHEFERCAAEVRGLSDK